MRIDASVTRRAKRSGRMAASRRRGARSSGGGSAAASARGTSSASWGSPAWRSPSSATRSAISSTSSGGPSMRTCSPRLRRPRGHLARAGVERREQHAALGRRDLAVAAEVALDQPGDAVADPDLRLARGLAVLPLGAVGVGARVEAGGPLEVVLGLRRVGDLAAHPREAEDAQRAALVAVAQQVELPALVEQVVGVDLAGPHLVALHRVVVEGDRLAAEDRRLDLGQALGQVVAAGAAGEAERQRAVRGRLQRRRAAPGDLLQREAQRLGVGELAVEQRQRELQRGELLVGERDRREVEVLGAQRVVLLLGDAVDGAVDGQVDPERLELGAVGVEAARERVLVHAAVALDVAADLQRGHRAPLRHEVRDERELADQLFGVLGHTWSTIDASSAPRERPGPERPRSLRRFAAFRWRACA